MRQVLLDTDTISYFFRNHKTVVSHFDTYLQTFGFLNLSVVTYYEILNGLYYKDAKRQLDSFERFVGLNKIIPLDGSTVKKAAQIYSDLRKMELPLGIMTL